MKRAFLILAMFAGCGRADYEPGGVAMTYQSDPARDEVLILIEKDGSGVRPPTGVILVPVGTRVTVVGPSRPMAGPPETWLRVNVREGRHRGVVGSIPVRFLHPAKD